MLAVGCSTTSTIYRHRGMPLEVDVLGGSPSTLFVQNDAGKLYEIPRADIESIDYPGNVHTAIGAGVLGYGVINIAVGLPACAEEKQQQAALCAGVFLPALVGAAIMLWGLGVNTDQSSAVADTSRHSQRRPKPELRPPATPVDDDDDDDEVKPRPKAPAAVYLEDDPPKVDLPEDPAGASSAKPVAPFVPHPPASTAPPAPAPAPPPPSKSFPVEP
jgi:hypothetical protein